MHASPLTPNQLSGVLHDYSDTRDIMAFSDTRDIMASLLIYTSNVFAVNETQT